MTELDQALQHHKAGRLEEAEVAYRELLAREPEHADALHLLGVLSAQSGNPQAAVELIEQAIASNPRIPDYHNNLGEAYRAAQAFDQAVAAYERALTLKSDLPATHYNLGNALHAQGKLDQAIAAFERALALNPNAPEIHNDLGVAFQAQGKLDQAIEAYEHALALNPELAVIHHNLGNALQAQGELDQAIAAYRRVLVLMPEDAEVYNKLGKALYELGKPAEAVAAYQQALALSPEFAEAYDNLGWVLQEYGELDSAISCHRRALALLPDYAEAHNKLGLALKDQGNLDAAIAAFQQALALEPGFVSVHSNLFLCMHYSSAFDAAALFSEARRFNARHGRPLMPTSVHHENDRSPERRLRIGYVSGSFRRHPIGYFFLPVFGAHDKSAFEIFCYAGVKNPDEMTERFIANADHWLDVGGVSDEDLAQQIRADDIDILVDLSGHQGGNRLLVFARMPAPVQVSRSYDTTGLDAMDYFLSDRFHTPDGTDRYFSEQLVRLPNGYVCYAPPDYAPPVGRLPANEQGYVTFGCFNGLAKITPEVVEVWARILKSLPCSRIKLQTLGLGDDATRERYLSLFRSNGIEDDRVDLGAKVPHKALLAAYAAIDIALDPFPYTGGLTTCEALWMGVPVVTLSGHTFVGRHSTSHLSNVGLTELVTETIEDYIAVASALAQDIERLSELRHGLRERMMTSPLCDAKRYTRDLEAAYREMWKKYCESSNK